MFLNNKKYDSRLALLCPEDDTYLNYSDLSSIVNDLGLFLKSYSNNGIALLNCRNDILSVCSYLAALEFRIPLILGEPRAMSGLIKSYYPN